SVQSLYEQNVAYYERLQNETVIIDTPDDQLDSTFGWAKVGVDKGIVTNPLLGTGLVAGYRTSGESERPGFAWFFGRDALWTAFALNSYGDFNATRTALEFLKKFQRADGKIPHEISQSASLIPWFTDYPYPWASADATPLYVITHADYWRASGDRKFLQDNWESIVKAYRFTEATDTDNNGLVENTKFGHGWVEGGVLYPPHEEIYQQGIWIEASRNLAEMAEVLNDTELKTRALKNAERTRAATEQTYWLPQRGFYAYATKRPTAEAPVAEPGPNRARRQIRLNDLKDATLYDEDTVLPAVPLWWRTLLDERAQSEIDHLGSGALATDWGARIISNGSRLYDPLSYHYGSVWPLFTGWASMGAYRYGRPHVGYQALMANALLTYQGALGYVTELLSGDFNAPFGRSSHHQIWSEAMVITPAVRGLLGIEVTGGGTILRFAPQLPAHWERVEVRNVAAGQSHYDLRLTRTHERLTITARQSAPPSSAAGQTVGQPSTLIVAPAFPLDARVRGVTVRGRPAQLKLTRAGDVQHAEVTLIAEAPETEVVFNYTAGTDVYYEPTTPLPGAQNEGLRILRSAASASALRLTLEGLAGRSYPLRVRTPRRLGTAEGVTVTTDGDGAPRLVVSFDGAPPGSYVRRELTIPLQTPPRRR
ncbi:MAG: amylo-alpha-1,6-glucosidase, partial [Pyrinomonadaceae bacterium]|nr:amylo-alpha-1,6-glucosidase [Pyrinomonadaceae bacterium]